MEHAALVIAVFLFAGAVKGVVGLGLPAIALALLGLVMPPAVAAAVIVLPSILTNVWQAWAGPDLRGLLWRLAPLLAGTLGGIWLAVSLGLGIADPALARIGIALLGGVLVLYALYGLLAPVFRIPPAIERRWAAPVGGVTGVITAATGILMVPGAGWIQALGLPRDHLVQALGIFLTVGNFAFGASLALDGVLNPERLLLSLVAVPAAMAGMWVGARLRRVVAPDLFRKVFLVALLLLGAYQAARPFW